MSRLIIVLGALCALPAVSFGDDAAKLAFFENQIRPLLAEHCFECHNAEKQQGGARLDLRESMIEGGDSGPAIVVGKPEASLLIEAVRYESYEMPPDGPLPEEDIAKLTRWIREGAVWPETDEAAQPSLGDQEAIRRAADEHWAFQPIERPTPPATSDSDWVREPLDQFVLANLQTAGLRPSPEAEPKTLVRRAFYDLIGLPPTPEIAEAVVGTREPSRLDYEQLVERLLRSPHYGERMARHWMDVARYADTRDFQAAADLRYPFAYTYRDWLIQAFNSDLSFDDFIRHQLAADYLADSEDDPDLAALGFLTVGPLFRNNKLQRVADRIDVVSRGLMGMTAACARCHDHKYDPISIEDYYALYGVFRDSVRPKDFPTIENPLGHQPPESLVRDFERALQAEKDKLADYERGLAEKAVAAFLERPADYLLSYLELRIEKSETTRGLKSKRNLEETALTPIEKNLEQFRRDQKNISHPVLGPLAALIAVPDKAFPARKQQYLKQHGERLEPAVRRVVESSATRRELAQRYGGLVREAARSRQAPSDEAPSDEAQLASIRKWLVEPQQGPFVITPAAASRASRLLGKGRQALLKFQQAIADVEATHPGAPAKAMALQDAKRRRPTFVMYRGEPSRRGPKVEHRFPDYFAGSGENRFERGSGRLELAEQIVDRSNPLTARVIVNRVWRMHFGQGLVSDAGDFGLRTDPPAQRGVMDHLAASLIEHDWSLKWLHKTIMTSATYRQRSSAMNPPRRADGTSAAEIDADNQLLWRQNRRRMDFESMRDAMLAVAGTLDTSIGGRSVKLSRAPHPTRRTLYAYVNRVEPNPLFATFDVPSPDVSSAQRTETLVPQQALFAMNSPFVTEQARAMVARDDFQQAESDRERLRVLFERALGRKPRTGELKRLSQFVEEARALEGRSGPVWQYGFGPAEDGVDSFQPLSHFDGKRYTFEAEFPSPQAGYVMLTRPGGHPGKHAGQSSIRRWTAPADMLVRIAGTVHTNADRGDGVRAIVRINGKAVEETVAGQEPQKTIAGYHRVKAGDAIDFVVAPRQSPTADGYRWTVLIEQRDRSRENVLRRWHSARDFAAPPPPPMDAWEQTAQALMMTNEFLFVD